MGVILSTPRSENKYIHNTVKHKNFKVLSSSNLSFSIVKLLHVKDTFSYFFKYIEIKSYKAHNLIDTLYYIAILECNAAQICTSICIYIYTHRYIYVPQYYKHPKKINNLDKAVPVSFSSIVT